MTQKKKNALWIGGGDTGRPKWVALIALVGAVAIALCFLAQNSALFSPRSSDAEDCPLRISELMSENLSAYRNEKGDAPDWIEVVNTGSESIDLAKYTLVLDSKPNKAFLFPKKTLHSGEYCVVSAEGIAGKERELVAPFKLPASGDDALTLLSPGGHPVDRVELPELEADASYCRDASGQWQVSYSATPGEANAFLDAEAAGEKAVVVTSGDLEVTEVMSYNSLYCPDGSGECHDYVELHNKSGREIDLTGWFLSDESERLKKWEIPSGTIPAGGYKTVYCSGYERADGSELHASFKLSQEGETVCLTSPEGVTVACLEIPYLENDQAYSLADGVWGTELPPTPGLPNTLEASWEVNRASFASARGSVYISEIMASPSSQDYDWVELYNASSEAFDLSGCGLSDRSGKPRKWQFPQGTVIQPGSYLGIYLSGQEAEQLAGFLNASFALSKDGGYTLCLSDPMGKVLDALYVPRQYGGISYGRASDGCYYFAEGTPMAENNAARYSGKAATARYSVAGGLFTTGDSFSVELSAPEGSRIYYTLDCSDPTENSQLYSGPIPVSSTTILRTKVCRDGYLDSYMDTQSYLFDVYNPTNVTVVSLVSDEYNLYSDEAGILAMGPNAKAKYPYGSMNNGANFWMDWEREGHIELFDPAGDQLLTQECGIKLHGQYSRACTVKAFKIFARNEYGKNRFEYPIFSKRDYGDYQSFLLRASGQDYNLTFMRDSVLTALADTTSVAYQESELAICYLNGKFHSLYYLRERVSKFSICQFEGWEGMEDDIDLVKANSNVKQGSNETYAALIEWLKSHDSSTEEAYQVIDSVIDIQNYIEYMSLEIFVGNGDTLNVKRYRNAKADGKWRWVLFDLDWAFFTDTNSINRWLTPGGMGTGKYTDNTLFISCMKNPRFRDEFLTYFGQQLATTYSTENVMARFTARYEILSPLLPQYLEVIGMSEKSYKHQLDNLVRYIKTRPTKILTYFNDQFHFSDADLEKYFGDAIRKIQENQSEGS